MALEYLAMTQKLGVVKQQVGAKRPSEREFKQARQPRSSKGKKKSQRRQWQKSCIVVRVSRRC